MKRDGILVAVAVFSLLLQIPAASAQSLKTVYIGLVSITPSNAPVIAAADGGYFKKQGLDGKPLVMSGSTTALAAMLSGDVGFINVAGSGLINAYLGGRDAVMIAGLVNFAPYDLIVAKGINTIEDLKGKKVGIARFGGSADFLARYGLEKHGIKPGRDVTILQTGGNAERLSAAPGCDQATLLEQGFRLSSQEGQTFVTRLLTIGLDYSIRVRYDQVLIAKNRELVTGFLALIEATSRYKTDSPSVSKCWKTSPISISTRFKLLRLLCPKVGAVPYVNLKGMKLLDTTAEFKEAKNIKPEEISDNTL
jgi:ABC-type nitrate/sulfonate/bicarbonate transport system substrate-binding protein